MGGGGGRGVLVQALPWALVGGPTQLVQGPGPIGTQFGTAKKEPRNWPE